MADEKNNSLENRLDVYNETLASLQNRIDYLETMLKVHRHDPTTGKSTVNIEEL